MSAGLIISVPFCSVFYSTSFCCFCLFVLFIWRRPSRCAGPSSSGVCLCHYVCIRFYWICTFIALRDWNQTLILNFQNYLLGKTRRASGVVTVMSNSSSIKSQLRYSEARVTWGLLLSYDRRHNLGVNWNYTLRDIMCLMLVRCLIKTLKTTRNMRE